MFNFSVFTSQIMEQLQYMSEIRMYEIQTQNSRFQTPDVSEIWTKVCQFKTLQCLKSDPKDCISDTFWNKWGCEPNFLELSALPFNKKVWTKIYCEPTIDTRVEFLVICIFPQRDSSIKSWTFRLFCATNFFAWKWCERIRHNNFWWTTKFEKPSTGFNPINRKFIWTNFLFSENSFRFFMLWSYQKCM